ncbi:hypothetical protein EJB05_28437 [Eragrostis curvula]|nr:hypothetical protein EJB05_28437 [Eragrostis curvula]
MAAAAADPPGYFVGRPLHYQEQPQQAAPPPPRQVAAPAVGDQNSVAAEVPGYYAAPVQASPQPAASPVHNSATGASATDGSASQLNTRQGFFARW